MDETCDCVACTQFTAAYLHHLFRSDEVLGLRLASVHNLRFLARQTEVMREAIDAGTFETAYREFHDRYVPVANPTPVGAARPPKGRKG